MVCAHDVIYPCSDPTNMPWASLPFVVPGIRYHGNKHDATYPLGDSRAMKPAWHSLPAPECLPSLKVSIASKASIQCHFWQAMHFFLWCMPYHGIAAMVRLLMARFMPLASNYCYSASHHVGIQQLGFPVPSFIAHAFYSQAATYPLL